MQQKETNDYAWQPQAQIISINGHF